MTKTISPILLSQVPTGNCFTIRRVLARGEVGQRLIDFGFVKKRTGRVIREALLKDPIEIELGSTLISLRRSEAALVEVEPVE